GARQVHSQPSHLAWTPCDEPRHHLRTGDRRHRLESPDSMSGTKARTARGNGSPDLREPQVASSLSRGANERRGAGERPPRQNDDELVDFAEITEIELRILR